MLYPYFGISCGKLIVNISNEYKITWDFGRDVTYETLISNLDGYEKAKSRLRDNGSLHGERMKYALLQYRRQNNIFEVGDAVLPNSGLSDEVCFLTSEASKGLQFCFKTKSCARGVIFKTRMKATWRHATNEEIVAGVRLS